MIKTQKGFSLNELMVVIAIFAILVAIAVPNIASSVPTYRLKKATRDLSSNLRKARMQAVKKNRTMRVRFNTGNNTYQVEELDQNGNIIVQTTHTLDRGVSFGWGNATQPPGGGTLTDQVEFNGNDFDFNPQGLMVDNQTSGFIYLQNGRGEARAISVRVSGGITIREWRGSGWQQ